jgi:hypothetical protein
MPLIRLNNQSISSVTALPGGIDTGKVLQVQQTTKQNAVSYATASYAGIGLDVSITPTSASSDILILVTAQYGGNQDSYAHGRLYRDSSPLFIGTSASGNQVDGTVSFGFINDQTVQYILQTSSVCYKDTADNTNSRTYSLKAYARGGSAFKLNMPYTTDNGNYIISGASSITAIEIAT